MNLSDFIDIVYFAFTIAIFTRVILSFAIPMAGARPHPLLISINQVVSQITEPILAPIRRVLPTFGAFDFSPMVALLMLFGIKELLQSQL